MISDTLVATALEKKGLCYGDPQKRLAYVTHLFAGDIPPGSPPSAEVLSWGASMQSCLLHLRALMAQNEVNGQVIYHGTQVDILRCPYRPFIGQIAPMVESVARRDGALVTFQDQANVAALVPGDMVLIGNGGSAPKDPVAAAKWLREWGGPIHGSLVVDVDSGGRVVTLDGGQTDDRNGGKATAIAEAHRLLERRHNGWWLGGRRIQWRIRTDALSPVT